MVHSISTLTFSLGIENSLLNYIRLNNVVTDLEIKSSGKYKTVTLDVFSEILLDIC